MCKKLTVPLVSAVLPCPPIALLVTSRGLALLALYDPLNILIFSNGN